MAVQDIYQFKRHTGSVLHGIFIATGRAEAAMTAKGNKFKLTEEGTAIHGSAKAGLPQLIIFSIFFISVSLG